MNIIGIIAEYNPFHNGHLYHIEAIKRLYPNSLIVLVLNGYFLQRGELSILSKEDKVKLALNYNVNLVVELPFVFGSQSADIFADASIKLLNELKVDKIIFGSESNDIKLLESIAKMQLNNKSYNLKVKKLLKEGVNYPTALAKALNLDKNINYPNDLLGISYLKSILKNKFDIAYESIQRTNDYHDIKSTQKIISATNIRGKLKNNEKVKKYMPREAYKMIKNFNTNYFPYLKYKIISAHDLSKYLSVDEGIENLLKKVINQVNNLDELIKAIKSKRYTYNKINRMFIHILIGLTKEDNSNLELDYIKVLGFDNIGKKYLNKIKKTFKLPIYNHKQNSKIAIYEQKSSLTYDLITNQKTYHFELNNKPIIKEEIK